MDNESGVLSELTQIKRPCVLITVAYTAGSAPREAGAKMIVSSDQVSGTIGGGNLEHQAIQTARENLEKTLTTSFAFIEIYALGPMLEQCCGGVVFLQYEILLHTSGIWIDALKIVEHSSEHAVMVTHTGKRDQGTVFGKKTLITTSTTFGSLGDKKLDQFAHDYGRSLLEEEQTTTKVLFHPLNESKGRLPDYSEALLFETIIPCDFHITLFGAGHVGAAIIALLDLTVPCKVSWVDSRKEIFPEGTSHKVDSHYLATPTSIVPDIPANSFCLVMTHSHEQDQAICEAVLEREDIRFLGLIGSQTKKKRFVKRMKENGIQQTQLSRLVCPIGISGITSKSPSAIAISVVAQLLQLYEGNKAQSQHTDKEKIQAL